MRRMKHDFTIRRGKIGGIMDRVVGNVTVSNYHRVLAKAWRRTIQVNADGLGEVNRWAWGGQCGMTADSCTWSLIG